MSAVSQVTEGQVTEGVLPDTLDNALCASAVLPCFMESKVDRRHGYTTGVYYGSKPAMF